MPDMRPSLAREHAPGHVSLTTPCVPAHLPTHPPTHLPTCLPASAPQSVYLVMEPIKAARLRDHVEGVLRAELAAMGNSVAQLQVRAREDAGVLG